MSNNHLIESILKLVRLLKARDPHVLCSYNLTVLQVHTLVFIKRNQPVPMHIIAEDFRITKPTATSLIDVLLKSDFVERLDDKDDRRIIRVKLSKKGENFLAKHMKKTNSKINKALSLLSPKDKADLQRIIQTINEKIQEEYEKDK
jgi:DNA-binding MarR family transcriptional regulator